MLIWFLVAAPFLVAEIFRSPLVDYRLVALGAVLPVTEVAIGRPFVLHTLAAPVLVMAVTMLTTMGRRLLRRRLLGLSIGLFLHLVLDGAWSVAHLFWWPVFGFSFAGLDVPEASSLGWRLVLELAGVALGFVAWRRHGLDDPVARQRLVRTGHLPATVRVGSGGRGR